MLTDPALNAELRTYCARLVSMEENLSGRLDAAEIALKGYETAGRGMAEIAKRYAEAMKEREEVQAEITKLEARASDID
jgi:chromosome segregation ATPase